MATQVRFEDFISCDGSWFVSDDVELEFKDDEARKVWDNFVEEAFQYGYASVIRYAEYLAKFMQYLIAKHKGITVADIAGQASHVADIEGITGSMYSCAVMVLSKTWKHGETLLKWHNSKYGYEGDGIVNPTVMAVK